MHASPAPNTCNACSILAHHAHHTHDNSLHAVVGAFHGCIHTSIGVQKDRICRPSYTQLASHEACYISTRTGSLFHPESISTCRIIGCPSRSTYIFRGILLQTMGFLFCFYERSWMPRAAPPVFFVFHCPPVCGVAHQIVCEGPFCVHHAVHMQLHKAAILLPYREDTCPSSINTSCPSSTHVLLV